MTTRRLMPPVAMLLLAVAVMPSQLFGRPTRGAVNSSLDAKDTEKRVDEAAQVLTDIMGSPDKGIPADLLGKAACVVIIPGVKKGAFIVGAKYGRGFIMCRK